MADTPTSDDTARTAALRAQPVTGLRAWLHRATEPYILFPAVAALIIAVLWISTVDVIRLERANARAVAAASTTQLVDTYEAQVVRALREIDQTLKLVKFVAERRGAVAALADLRSRELLPPDLLFVVTIVDRDGGRLAGTRPAALAAPAAQGSSADRNYLAFLRTHDTLWVSMPTRDGASGEWMLQFARALRSPDGVFEGAVLESVAASYFVSGYDPAQLGHHGVLGLLGDDGVFRVRRTGDEVSASDGMDYAALLPPEDQTDPVVSLGLNHWDGVRRYTGLARLYGSSLVVLVGLSETEQLATAQRHARTYVERVTIANAAVILVAVLLGRLSWQLSRSRARQAQAELQYAQRIEYLAYHDGLTALPNRSFFNKLLSQLVSQAERYQRPLAVGFVDLDRFKQINDTLGHEAGDQLLKEVSARLKGCLRDSDIVARLGGDEFVVLLPELSDEQYVATVARKIVAAIARPYMLRGRELRVTASIGISLYPKDGRDARELTKNADIAMYQAKEDGKNGFRFFSEKLRGASLERRTTEAGLRRALANNEFQLHYQVKRDIGTGRITGTEVLLRWKHPQLGLLMPSQFLSIAEESGLILPIGRWVLQTACRESVGWQRQGLPPLSIAINLTARQFNDEQLLSDISSALQASGMNPELLEMEVHESLLIRDMHKTLKVLTGLKTLGVKIAIDDFGAGYSTLATLQQFPVDTIKIDRSFIRGVATVAEDGNLADAIIAMGKQLSLTVVAQGVETREQADFLREHACDEFQGFYLQKPISAQQFASLLREQRSDESRADPGRTAARGL